MGKSTIIFIASAICLFSLLGITQATEESDNYQFILEGIVYCDPCRSIFKTNLSEPVAGIYFFKKYIIFLFKCTIIVIGFRAMSITKLRRFFKKVKR